MSNVVVPVTAGTLPTGFCPATLQDMLNGFSAAQTVTLPGTNIGVVISPTKPTDTTVFWIQQDTLGRPVRGYLFAQGAWLALHPQVPGMIVMWTGALPDFTTFDGGDANALSPISGPMWQSVMAGTTPLGAGTLASGAVITPGQTGGEEKHVLTAAEGPPHVHSLTGLKNDNMSRNDLNILVYPGNQAPFGGDANANSFPNTATALGDPTTGNPPASAAAHNNLPPFTGVVYLQRTTRLFYAVQ